VVERVSRLLGYLSPGTMTTAAYVELDPETETAAIVSAGHPPPLLVEPDGTARFLDVEGDPALGVSAMTRFHERRFAVPSGSTLLVYTDGVVEVRGESIDIGLERLRGLAERRARDGVEALCDAVIRELVASGRPSDDVALLALHMRLMGDRLHGRWPARATALADVRHLLRRWLRHHGAADDESYDITVACQEACANAVEHAYAPGIQSFEIDASCIGGTVEIVVSDSGQWREPRGSNRGRGLPLMRTLMDDVDVRSGEGGTSIVMRRALGAAGR
jgi:anti-sigma regulatory factor (Ser/Thr protein kinase)